MSRLDKLLVPLPLSFGLRAFLILLSRISFITYFFLLQISSSLLSYFFKFYSKTKKKKKIVTA